MMIETAFIKARKKASGSMVLMLMSYCCHLGLIPVVRPDNRVMTRESFVETGTVIALCLFIGVLLTIAVSRGQLIRAAAVYSAFMAFACFLGVGIALSVRHQKVYEGKPMGFFILNILLCAGLALLSSGLLIRTYGLRETSAKRE